MIRSLLVAVALLASCSSSTVTDAGYADTGPTDVGIGDETARAFAPDHVLDVVVEMAPEDWDAIRHQGRDLSALAEGCSDGPAEKISKVQ